MRRNLVAALALLLLMALAWLAYVRSGRPRAVADVQGEVAGLPVGQSGAVAWLEADPGGDRVRLAGRGRRPRVLWSGSGLMGLALAGGKAFVTKREQGSEGQLLAVSLNDGQPQALATLKGEAAQVVVGDGLVAWLEERPAALPGVPFIAAAAPVTAIRSISETGGPISFVAAMPLDAPTTQQGARRPLADLLGIAGRQVYWLQREGGGPEQSASLRYCAPGSRPQTLAVETGAQQAVLLQDAVAWTSFSQEAADPRQYLAVKRQPLGGGPTQVIGDWLGPEAELLGSGRRLYAQDKEVLWHLGKRRGEQRVIYSRPPGTMGTRVIGEDQYLVLRIGKTTTVAKRPLTAWARARQLLGD